MAPILLTALTGFDAYGWQQSYPGSSEVFGYQAQWGGYMDHASGFVLMTHRYYDPTTGRFVTRDPIGQAGGINVYGYVGGDPVNWSDPSGLCPAYNPSYWNKPTVCPWNNCYNYARNDPSMNFLQPGAMSGKKYDNFPGGRPSCNNIIANARRDGAISVPPGGCPSGWHKVCVFTSADKGDYHWFRQDNNGYWSNKPGRTPVVNTYPNPFPPLYWPSIPVTDVTLDAGLHGYEDPQYGSLCVPDKPFSSSVGKWVRSVARGLW